MSWDISIEIKGIDNTYYLTKDIGNYTYNVMPMFHKAIGWESLNNDLNFMNCSDAIPFLEKGIKNMENNPEDYKKMNPDNGWGNYDGALKFLKNILNACKNTPMGRVVVC